MDINKHNEDTKTQINNITRPLTAYQYYTKHMRQKWKMMSDDEKSQFKLQSEHDKLRYDKERETITTASQSKIKSLNIYLKRSFGRVPCVGLDNGFYSYTIIGPIDTIELFTEEEKELLNVKGIVAPKYKILNSMQFNWRARKKWDVTVYGGNTNHQESWWRVLENYTGETGTFTRYNNYKGDTWTTKH